MTMVREMERGKCIHSLLLSSLILITTEVSIKKIKVGILGHYKVS